MAYTPPPGPWRPTALINQEEEPDDDHDDDLKEKNQGKNLRIGPRPNYYPTETGRLLEGGA